MQKLKYSVIIPMYNEEDSIKDTLIRVKKTMDSLKEPYEVIIVNDGSTDNSVNMVKQFNFAKLIGDKINRGYGASIKRGVIASSTNNIIITDADGTYPIEDIPRLVKHIDKYDLVSSSRFSGGSNISFTRKIGKFFHHGLINLLSKQKIPDMNSGLRVFKKSVFLKYYHLYPSGFSISTTFLLSCIQNDHPVKFVDIKYFRRTGKSKIKLFRDGFNFLILIIRCVTYFNPLRIFIPVSILFFMLSLGFFSIGLYFGKIPDITVILLGVTSILVGLFGLIADALSKILLNFNFGVKDGDISS